MQPATIQDLKKVIVLSDLPDEHLQWILDHSVYVEFEEGKYYHENRRSCRIS